MTTSPSPLDADADVTVDDLLAPPKVAVWLDEIELGLLRAGLAAHSMALDVLAKNSETKMPVLAAKQRNACRELSIRLGDAQNELAKRTS